MKTQTDHRLAITTALGILAILLAGAALAEDHNRASMTLNEGGQVLRFVGEADDEPTAVLESGGGSTDILAFGDTLGGEPVYGFGNIADLNDAGVAVMKVVTEEGGGARGINDDDLNKYLVTSDNGASPTIIAVATRDGVGGDTFGDSVLCNIGPMPEINNAGQVAWFGALTTSKDTPLECEDVAELPSFAFNQSFVDANGNENDPVFVFEELVGGNGTETEADIDAGDPVIGSILIQAGTAGSAIFRYSPGSGNALLLQTGDSINVTDSDFVASPTTFEVVEVRYIRDGTQKMSSGGALIGFVNLAPEQSMARGEDLVAGPCTATVASDSFPSMRYRDIECGGDAIVVFNGSTPTVVALSGPDSIYESLPDEGQVINNAGQVLFWARDQSGLPMIELYSPGLGTTTIAKGGDPVPTPGSDLIYCEFAPHYDLANDGSVAFQARIGESGCELEEFEDDNDRGAARGGGDGETALFHYASGQTTELFRTQDVADLDTGSGPFTSTWSGNEIDEIGSVAISPTSGLVQFYVENQDFVPGACEPRGSDSDFGGGEWTAMLSWTPDSGLESVMEEGDLLGTDGDDYIFRIYAMGPKLRQQANSSAELVALLDIDRDNDCDVDEDDEMEPGGDQVIVIGRGTPPTGRLLEIPVAGPLGLGIFAGALLLLSMMWVRSRAVGA